MIIVSLNLLFVVVRKLFIVGVTIRNIRKTKIVVSDFYVFRFKQLD